MRCWRTEAYREPLSNWISVTVAMALALSPLACIRWANEAFESSIAFGRPIDCLTGGAVGRHSWRRLEPSRGSRRRVLIGKRPRWGTAAGDSAQRCMLHLKYVSCRSCRRSAHGEDDQDGYRDNESQENADAG